MQPFIGLQEHVSICGEIGLKWILTEEKAMTVHSLKRMGTVCKLDENSLLMDSLKTSKQKEIYQAQNMFLFQGLPLGQICT